MNLVTWVKSLETAFWQSIHENPLDPHNYLIYADWLDEQGDAKNAAFYRKCGRDLPKITETTKTLIESWFLWAKFEYGVIDQGIVDIGLNPMINEVRDVVGQMQLAFTLDTPQIIVRQRLRELGYTV